jgi:hypothetical protein
MKVFWLTGTGGISHSEAASFPTTAIGHRMMNDLSYHTRPVAPYVAEIIEQSIVAVERSVTLLEMVDVKQMRHMWPFTERLADRSNPSNCESPGRKSAQTAKSTGRVVFFRDARD